MNLPKTIIAFSENSESHSLFNAFAVSNGYILQIKNKSVTLLASLLENRPELILVEIHQPIMAEIEFVDQVHQFLPDIPIVIVSSFFYDTKEVVFGNKIKDFILRPFELEAFTVRIKKILNKEIKVEPLKVVQKDIHYENKKLSVLFEISKSLNANRNLDDLLDQIVILSADAINAERATLFLVDKANKQLWSRSGIGLETKEIRIPIESGIAGEVATSGETQLIDDPYSHPKFNKKVDLQTGFVTRNILCLAIKNLHGEIIGVFQILNKKSGTFNEEDAMFLAAMAASTGIAIENALLQDELKRQIAQIKNSYEELYIAQNVILKESKISTTSEISGFITSKLLTDSKVDALVNEIKINYKLDERLTSLIDAISANNKLTTEEIINYLNNFSKS
ncbi:MAG: GAF domain-containing protein [Ignavibacteriaceae bacterium]|nr:GAF domain-containing protein [Ignavibacteriaceae bacterium]